MSEFLIVMLLVILVCIIDTSAFFMGRTTEVLLYNSGNDETDSDTESTEKDRKLNNDTVSPEEDFVEEKKEDIDLDEIEQLANALVQNVQEDVKKA